MIKINDVLYDAIPVNAVDGTMNITFKNTELSLSEIEAIFKSDPKIEVLENETVIATYYNKEIRSLTVKFSNAERNAIIYLAVTNVPDDVASILNGQIDSLKSELSVVKDFNSNLNSQIDTLKGTVKQVDGNLTDQLDTLKGTLNDVKESAEISDGAITELADITANTQSSTAVLEEAIQDLGATISELYDAIQTLINSSDSSDPSTETPTDGDGNNTDIDSSDNTSSDNTSTDSDTKNPEQAPDNSSNESTIENTTSDNEEVSNG